MEQEKIPSTYIFYGDDFSEIRKSISKLESHLDNRDAIEWNYQVFDGRSTDIEQVEVACKSLPILDKRRLTVVNHPLALVQVESNQKRLSSLLERLPFESAVVLAEYRRLPTDKEKREKKQNWLLKLAKSMGGKVFTREFNVPHLSGWIVKRANKMGGEIEPKAAGKLADLVGNDVRLAEQEIIKLLTYVNYERPVSEADVLGLTALQPEGFIFDFVDALGARNRKKAVNEFHRLLVESDIQNIFGMIVRQFRLLVQSREIIDQRGGEQEIAKSLGVHPFVGGKLAHQASQFSQVQLDAIFHRLLEIDAGLKTGKMSIDLSIDLLIAEIT
jgi:DNA polymerase-3 subunit delta